MAAQTSKTSIASKMGRFAMLSVNAGNLIQGGKRDQKMIAALFEALQLFKENRLAGVFSKNSPESIRLREQRRKDFFRQVCFFQRRDAALHDFGFGTLINLTVDKYSLKIVDVLMMTRAQLQEVFTLEKAEVIERRLEQCGFRIGVTREEAEAAIKPPQA